jgi:hypothetical protein
MPFATVAEALHGFRRGTTFFPDGSARTSRRQLSPLGKMRTTWVRRLISSFKRSSMLCDGPGCLDRFRGGIS